MKKKTAQKSSKTIAKNSKNVQECSKQVKQWAKLCTKSVGENKVHSCMQLARTFFVYMSRNMGRENELNNKCSRQNTNVPINRFFT